MIGAIASDVAALLKMAWRNRTWLLIAALAIAALAFQQDAQRIRRDLDAERVAHRTTVANYRIAAAQAKLDDAANAQRVAAQQARINQEISRDYQARLADARNRADALRLQLAQAAAHPGAGGAAPMPGGSAAAGGSDGAAAPDRLPVPAALTIEERLLATEQAIQLDALQHWVAAQAGIDMNGDQAR